jgi:signal-transduction protein with cAMP-binding, CBS, and nucleotidyltransferase domain
METVANIMEVKNQQGSGAVEMIFADKTALDAARLMNAKRVGSLLVTEGDQMPIGIVTERDMLSRIVAAERNPATTLVTTIMSSPVMTCRPTTRLDELRQVMREERIRHVPVMLDHGVVGMISIGDLNFARSETMVETIKELELYIASG